MTKDLKGVFGDADDGILGKDDAASRAADETALDDAASVVETGDKEQKGSDGEYVPIPKALAGKFKLFTEEEEGYHKGERRIILQAKTKREEAETLLAEARAKNDQAQAMLGNVNGEASPAQLKAFGKLMVTKKYWTDDQYQDFLAQEKLDKPLTADDIRETMHQVLEQATARIEGAAVQSQVQVAEARLNRVIDDVLKNTTGIDRDDAVFWMRKAYRKLGDAFTPEAVKDELVKRYPKEIEGGEEEGADNKPKRKIAPTGTDVEARKSKVFDFLPKR